MARVDLDQYRRVVDAARQVNPDSLKPGRVVYVPDESRLLGHMLSAFAGAAVVAFAWATTAFLSSSADLDRGVGGAATIQVGPADEGGKK